MLKSADVLQMLQNEIACVAKLNCVSCKIKLRVLQNNKKRGVLLKFHKSRVLVARGPCFGCTGLVFWFQLARDATLNWQTMPL